MHFEVVGTGAGGSTPGCMLVCEQQSYLFNAGGGTQRLCLEHHIRLSRIRSIFLTRLVPETVGGLPGMLLTTEDMGCDTMHIHGPPGTGRFMEATQFFCRPNTSLISHDWGSQSPAFSYVRANLDVPGARSKLGLPEREPLDDGRGKRGESQGQDEAEVEARAAAGAEASAGAAGGEPAKPQRKVRQYRGPVSKALDLRNQQIAASARRSIDGYSDDNIRLQPVIVQPAPSAGSALMEDDPDECKIGAADDVQYELPPRPEFLRPLPTSVSGAPPPLSAVSYIIRSAEIPGRFLPQRALQLFGLRPGPEFGRLQRGEAIELEVAVYEDDGSLVPPPKPERKNRKKSAAAPDAPSEAPAAEAPARAIRREKRTVRPEDVMEESQLGPVLFVIDCPTVEHTVNLVQQQAFAPWQNPEAGPAAGEGRLSMVCHMVPAQVWEHQMYQRWVQSFGPGAQHILLHPETSLPQSVFRSSDVIYKRLEAADSLVFPPLPSLSAPAADLRELPANVARGEMCLQYLVKPPERSGIVRDRCLAPITPEECQPSAEFVEALAAAQARLAELELQAVEGAQQAQLKPSTLGDSHPLAHEQKQAVWRGLAGLPEDMTPVVTFLGTGCASPSKYRNVSSIHLELQAGIGVMLDCGEGTYGQMLRRWGPAEATRRLLELRVVWISHMHADHHLGLLRVLGERTRAALALASLGVAGEDAPPPLLVIAPMHMGWWLEEFASVNQEPVQFEFMDNEQFLFEEGPAATQPEASLPPVLQRCLARLRACGLLALHTVAVDHCPFAYGISLEHAAGWKLVYSGDAKPTPRLVEMGAGATVLIHEATFEDDMQAEAHRKNHSTTSEAVGMGLAMGADAVLLTHFSQRYPKIAEIRPEHMDRAVVAFDLMQLSFKRLHCVPAIMPALTKLFDGPAAGDEEEFDLGNSDPPLEQPSKRSKHA